MQNFDGLKVALIHDQLSQYGGAEKTLEVLLKIFPQADIFTGSYKPINISQKILEHKIYPGKIPNWLGFLMPLAFEGFDLRQYDLILSEGTAWPKGVLTNPKQLHISYMYTPPRFLYGYATEGQKRDKWYFKPGLKIVDHFLRIWDYNAAQRPDFILSISKEVQNRVKKFYRRDSEVIYPPVELPKPDSELSDTKPGDYYLCISRLAAYKNLDKLIEAFNLTDLNLKIAGTGKEESKLKVLAGPRVEILGFVSETQKAELLKNCRGFVFPTDYEDFGIVVVEALAYGKPVLCHQSGGPLEIVEAGKTGLFFNSLDPKKLAESLKEFHLAIDRDSFSQEIAQKSAEKFSAQRFEEEISNFIKNKLEERLHARTP